MITSERGRTRGQLMHGSTPSALGSTTPALRFGRLALHGTGGGVSSCLGSGSLGVGSLGVGWGGGFSLLYMIQVDDPRSKHLSRLGLLALLLILGILAPAAALRNLWLRQREGFPTAPTISTEIC